MKYRYIFRVCMAALLAVFMFAGCAVPQQNSAAPSASKENGSSVAPPQQSEEEVSLPYSAPALPDPAGYIPVSNENREGLPGHWYYYDEERSSDGNDILFQLRIDQEGENIVVLSVGLAYTDAGSFVIGEYELGEDGFFDATVHRWEMEEEEKDYLPVHLQFRLQWADDTCENLIFNLVLIETEDSEIEQVFEKYIAQTLLLTPNLESLLPL